MSKTWVLACLQCLLPVKVALLLASRPQGYHTRVGKQGPKERSALGGPRDSCLQLVEVALNSAKPVFLVTFFRELSIWGREWCKLLGGVKL